MLAAHPSAAERPKVLVILADDQGWGDLSVHGNTNVRTPHIDSLARDGALFERFFVCPVCSPTRAEFLTGRYHPRGGVRDVSTGGERLDLDERTIAEVFRAAGYATGAFGKWHNGAQFPYHPRGRGFDEFYGFCSGHWGDYFDPPLEHNGELVRGDGYITDDLTTHALAFMKATRDRPFFCYVPFNTPHTPLQVPDRFFDRFRRAEIALRYPGPQPEDVPATRAVLAMCENIDGNVGRLLDGLDHLGVADNTIVLYFSDNGPNTWRWNGGMRGRKGSTDEGGVRSPLLVRWPGHIPPGTKLRQISAAIDLLPTLAELAGVSVPRDRPLDGISVAPALLGQSELPAERMIFSHWNRQVSVRTPRYRLDASGRLYDMDADPGQTRDLAKQRPDVAAKLSEAAARWKDEMLPSLTKDDRPFPVGYPAFPITWLPARDGIPHGHITRSAPAPNCSYFTNWTSVDDSLSWDVEIATAGRYEVVVYYTCAQEDVGSVLELRWDRARLRGRVAEAHDPPPRGAEHDRVPRTGESLVKDFKPLRLGAIELERGRGALELHAVEMPGRRVIDVRALRLILRK